MKHGLCGSAARGPGAGAVVLVLALTNWAAGQPQTWTFDETTSGEDVNWVSPTAVDPSAPRYHFDFEITLAEVTVLWFGIPIGPFDVTDQIPPEQQSITGCIQGPAPVLLFDEAVVVPAPPEPAAVSADLVVGIDAAGFGYLAATNVVLGTATVDLGPPFGEQEVQLLSIRLAGTLVVTPEFCPAEFTGDGLVDAADLAVLLGSWGPCVECLPDMNCDEVIDAADLALLLGNWGPCP